VSKIFFFASLDLYSLKVLQRFFIGFHQPFPWQNFIKGGTMTKGIFITGTDTGVGKTYVGVGITSALRKLGVDVGVMKPAETGCRRRGGELIPADAVALMKASGSRDPLDLVNPYRFSKPLAPSVAAALEGERVEKTEILAAYRKLKQRHEFMLVEGAGGIMVPLSDDYLYLDLVKDLKLPVMIVARPSLGTINHTLLTIMALRSAKVTIAGIVINHAKESNKSLAERTSPGVIEEISGVPILGIVRHGGKAFTAIATAVLYSRATQSPFDVSGL
jgi:dethiobiotin synthetase